MNANKVLVGEYMVAIGFVSWFAIKNQEWPWPGTIIKISVSFAIFGITAQAAPEFAAVFAGGVLLAAFLKVYSKGLSTYRGGVPDIEADTFPYRTLDWMSG